MGAYHIGEFEKAFYKVLSKKDFDFIATGAAGFNKPNNQFSLVVKSTQQPYATFGAQTLPGCCGVLLVDHVRAKDPKKVLALIVKAASLAKYGVVMHTQIEGTALANQVESKHAFVNPKTGNLVEVHVIDVPPLKIKAVKAVGGE